MSTAHTDPQHVVHHSNWAASRMLERWAGAVCGGLYGSLRAIRERHRRSWGASNTVWQTVAGRHWAWKKCLGKAVDTMNDNMQRLEARTVAAAEAALAARKVVTAIDVLQGIGWLPQARVDEWRQGRLGYLEGGVSTNLHKISAVMRMFRRWAQSRGLAPRETAYVSRTRDRHQLRFSKSGELAIERAYRTHWVSPDLSAAKQERLAERHGRAPDLVVISPLSDWTCSKCGGTGDFLLMDDTGPLCRFCAKLDQLVYLPAGDAALSRHTKQASGLSAIVVRFSRSRKRYERQGILIEESALKQAEGVADDQVRRPRRSDSGDSLLSSA